MKFAVALFALTLLVSQTVGTVGAQSISAEEAVVAKAPIVGSDVSALGGEGSGKQKLQLTDQQKEKFYELKNKLLDEAGPKKLALHEQQRALKDLLTKDSIDRKAIAATQEKINSLRTDLANIQIAFRMDVSEQLSAEQRKVMRYSHMKSGKAKARGARGKMHRRFPRAEQNPGTNFGAEPAATQEPTAVETLQPANI